MYRSCKRELEMKNIIVIINIYSIFVWLQHHASLRGMTQISTNQFDFMPRKSTTEAIFLIRQVMERFIKQKKDLHLVFIDLEKAYDKILKNVMWWALDKHKVP